MNPPHPAYLGRRAFLTSAGATVALGMAGKEVGDWNEWNRRADVMIVDAPSYEVDLESILKRGLGELGLGPAWCKGKRVLLKPNLVETSLGRPQINTHPLVIRAAAETFRSWGARSVAVGEGPGHCRDALLVVDQSGLYPILKESRLPFVDLNNDDVAPAPNPFRATTLGELSLPVSLLAADLIVSVPKLKTHHWVGVTLAMKNFFGVMPGVVYGWPKNVLHFAGINESILDIVAAVKPHLAIVDAIVGMEGDGPLMGEPRRLGALVLGTNLPAVDATCTRLMGFNPWRVPYLVGASGKLGPISERHIAQRGETIASRVQEFKLLDIPALTVLRT